MSNTLYYEQLGHKRILTPKLLNKTRPTNSDGIIKCLRQRQDRFVINP
jgi:hypothetical protein